VRPVGGYTHVKALRRQPKPPSFLHKCVAYTFFVGNFGIQSAKTLLVHKSSCKIFNTVVSDIPTSSAIIETLIPDLPRPKPQLS
jgi:hypothetical protein